MSVRNMSSLRGLDKGLREYINSASRFPLITAEEERECGKQYKKTGNKRFRDKLILSNLRFVVKTAMQYASYGFPIMDIIQEGNRGLTLAVEKWNPDREVRVISFAIWQIRACIYEYISRNWSLVKIGTTQAQKKVFHRLNSAKWRDQDNAVILYGLDGVTDADIDEMKHRMRKRDKSLDDYSFGTNDDQRSLHEVLADDAPHTEDVLGQVDESALLSDVVGQALGSLDLRKRRIICARFLSEESTTLEELGDELGISKERVRQLEQQALKFMRMLFACGELVQHEKELLELLGGGVFKDIKPPPGSAKSKRVRRVVALSPTRVERDAVAKLTVGLLNTLSLGSELANEVARAFSILKQLQGEKEG